MKTKTECSHPSTMKIVDSGHLSCFGCLATSIYRIEWMHNGNWRMDNPPKGEFRTYADALRAAGLKEYEGLETRICAVPS